MEKRRKKMMELVQGSVTLVLFILIFFMIHYVNDIQGTARVVNYAGLVRGATQRMVKLEDAGVISQDKIDELGEYLHGIQYGSQDLNLICIEDEKYQEKVTQLAQEWENLKEEILRVRQVGYENTNIVESSEKYFQLSDEVVGLAEQYSQRCATRIRNVEILVIGLIVLLVLFMIQQSMTAIRMKRMNRLLGKRVYVDEQTGLPNKTKCMELLNDPAVLEEDVCIFMFDLNNLKSVNDYMGHEAGDRLISDFAQQIRSNISAKYFVGRYGGDEFIAIIQGEDMPDPNDVLQAVQDGVNLFNQSGDEIPISYAAGYSRTADFEVCTLQILLDKADKNMYIDKKQKKKQLREMEEQLNMNLEQMQQAFGKAYINCFYYNIQTGSYRTFKQMDDCDMPLEGRFLEEFKKSILPHVQKDDQERMMELLSADYMKQHLKKEEAEYSMSFGWIQDQEESYRRMNVIYVNQDKTEELSHCLIAFEEITDEMKLEYGATHDGLTKLLNRTAAWNEIEELVAHKPQDYHVMFVLDIDHFKLVNDNFGHQVGDQALIAVAQILQRTFRYEDVVARYGGDEFIIFMPNIKTENIIERKSNQILEQVRECMPELKLTVSIGACCVQEYVTIESLFYQADKALYEAKKAGRDCYALKKI